MKELMKEFFKKLGIFVNYENENYIEPEEYKKKGEKFLDYMDDLEKSCYTFIREKEKELKKIAEKYQLLINEKDKAHELFDLKQQTINLDISMDIVRAVLTASIQTKFQPSSEKSSGMAFRKNFKIVETFNEKIPSVSIYLVPGLV